jgi:hypothetical protein
MTPEIEGRLECGAATADDYRCLLADLCRDGVPVPWDSPEYSGMVAADYISRILRLEGRMTERDRYMADYESGLSPYASPLGRAEWGPLA